MTDLLKIVNDELLAHKQVIADLREENAKLREQRDREIRAGNKTYAADLIIDIMNKELEQLKTNQKGAE